MKFSKSHLIQIMYTCNRKLFNLDLGKMGNLSVDKNKFQCFLNQILFHTCIHVDKSWFLKNQLLRTASTTAQNIIIIWKMD